MSPPRQTPGQEHGALVAKVRSWPENDADLTGQGGGGKRGRHRPTESSRTKGSAASKSKSKSKSNRSPRSGHSSQGSGANLNRQATRKRIRRRRLLWAGGISLFLLIAAAGALVYYMVKIPLPDAPPLAQTTFVHASNGDLLAELHADQYRIDIPFEGTEYNYRSLPPHLISAVVAREDRTFFSHRGVDFWAIVRAAWADLRNKPKQGGSTIPQQYVKNVFLSNERTMLRKLKEIPIAVKLTRRYSKDEIMSMYLNVVYFGRGAYGIEAAAKKYFAKGARDLTVGESAYLAGLISRPSGASPQQNPEEAMRRRDATLDAMVQVGSLISDQAAAEKNSVDDEGHQIRRPILTVETPTKSIASNGGSAYFTDYVRSELVRRYGKDAVFRGGLTVQTTLDPRIQESAESAVRQVLNRQGDPDVAIVTLDDDGRVVAMVGGQDFDTYQTNLAVGKQGGGTGRQFGSAFKPIVLAAALRDGISPETTFSSASPGFFKIPGGKTWRVRNAGDSQGGGGKHDLVSSMISSYNTVYAQLGLQVGTENMIETAKALGIDTRLPATPSIALGAGEVSALEMARAYSTFANRGLCPDVDVIQRVTNSQGRVLYEFQPNKTRVLTDEQADTITYALHGVVTSGTGKRANISGVSVAGKTGTTNDHTDASFVGYTAKYSTSVWIGYREGTKHKLNSVHGSAVWGGTLPAEIFRRHMEQISYGDGPGELPGLAQYRGPKRSGAGGAQSPTPGAFISSKAARQSRQKQENSSQPPTSAPIDADGNPVAAAGNVRKSRRSGSSPKGSSGSDGSSSSTTGPAAVVTAGGGG